MNLTADRLTHLHSIEGPIDFLPGDGIGNQGVEPNPPGQAFIHSGFIHSARRVTATLMAAVQGRPDAVHVRHRSKQKPTPPSLSSAVICGIGSLRPPEHAAGDSARRKRHPERCGMKTLRDGC